MLHVEAELIYEFPGSAEVLLLLEAARSSDQAIQNERLTITPSVESARLGRASRSFLRRRGGGDRVCRER
jgi:hypothetical protein